MHSFRPVFALPPCAPHPGNRCTPVALHSWIYLALVGCHAPACAFQSETSPVPYTHSDTAPTLRPQELLQCTFLPARAPQACTRFDRTRALGFHVFRPQAPSHFTRVSANTHPCPRSSQPAHVPRPACIPTRTHPYLRMPPPARIPASTHTELYAGPSRNHVSARVRRDCSQ